MARRGLLALLCGLGLVLGGCMQSTLDPTTDASFTARDKKLLAAAPYQKVQVPEPYQRHIVSWHRKELPGTIVIDSDARYLYYVLPAGKAMRYGVTVGEEAMAWSGVAEIKRMTEWPSWTPTAGERERGTFESLLATPARPLEGRVRQVGNRDALVTEPQQVVDQRLLQMDVALRHPARDGVADVVVVQHLVQPVLARRRRAQRHVQVDVDQQPLLALLLELVHADVDHHLVVAQEQAPAVGHERQAGAVGVFIAQKAAGM